MEGDMHKSPPRSLFSLFRAIEMSIIIALAPPTVVESNLCTASSNRWFHCIYRKTCDASYTNAITKSIAVRAIWLIISIS